MKFLLKFSFYLKIILFVFLNTQDHHTALCRRRHIWSLPSCSLPICIQSSLLHAWSPPFTWELFHREERLLSPAQSLATTCLCLHTRTVLLAASTRSPPRLLTVCISLSPILHTFFDLLPFPGKLHLPTNIYTAGLKLKSQTAGKTAWRPGKSKGSQRYHFHQSTLRYLLRCFSSSDKDKSASFAWDARMKITSASNEHTDHEPIRLVHARLSLPFPFLFFPGTY